MVQTLSGSGLCSCLWSERALELRSDARRRVWCEKQELKALTADRGAQGAHGAHGASRRITAYHGAHEAHEAHEAPRRTQENDCRTARPTASCGRRTCLSGSHQSASACLRHQKRGRIPSVPPCSVIRCTKVCRHHGWRFEVFSRAPTLGTRDSGKWWVEVARDGALSHQDSGYPEGPPSCSRCRYLWSRKARAA